MKGEGFLGAGLFRIFLSLVVVVHHFSRVMLGAWAVFVFFILSGYWVARMWDKKYRLHSHAYRHFMVSRFLRLFPILCVCNLLSYFTLGYLGWELPFTHSFLWWIRSLFILSSASQPLILGPFWSLDIELQYYFLAPLICWLWPVRKSMAMLFVGSACLFTVAMAAMNLTAMHHPTIKLGFYYLGFFMLGMGIHYFKFQIGSRAAWVSALTIVVVILVTLIHPMARSLIIWQESIAWQRYQELWAAFVAILSVPLVAYLVNRPSSRLDFTLGSLAYPVYAFHYLPAAIYYGFYGHLPSVDRIVPLACALFAVAVGSCLLYFFVDKPCEHWRKNWSLS